MRGSVAGGFSGDVVAGAAQTRPPRTVWGRRSPQRLPGSPPARKRSRCTSLNRRSTGGATSGSIRSCQCFMRASPTVRIKRCSPVLSMKSRCERSSLTGDFLARSEASRSSSTGVVTRSSSPVRLSRRDPFTRLSCIWKVGGGPIPLPASRFESRSPAGEVKPHVGKQRCQGRSSAPAERAATDGL